MKKVLKSVVAVVLCLAMVLSLAACGPKYTNGISTEEFTDKKTGVSYKGRIKIGAAILARALTLWSVSLTADSMICT